MNPEVSLPPAITSYMSNTFSYLTVVILFFIYFFLFALALWLCVSIYCYIIEVLVWFLLERHTRSSPGNLFDIMIPNPDLQLRMKLVVTETGVWFSRLLDRFKGVSNDQKIKQELPVPIPATNYRTGEMEWLSTDCAICLDDFVDGDSCRILIVCNHIFHSNCIDQWLKYQLTCPICRKPIDM
ncbi:hypothetical protein Dsin_022389 [Dipteronia sinensis]|uniref:RING-type domain-containing protein n=1 Tax=Dipteronia sinensis TaxID=43782 RepID=A0AAE0A2E4_9ROSI|nr:hypothetical protein Dsin_022389 [Dipteronia sinensis]